MPLRIADCRVLPEVLIYFLDRLVNCSVLCENFCVASRRDFKVFFAQHSCMYRESRSGAKVQKKRNKAHALDPNVCGAASRRLRNCARAEARLLTFQQALEHLFFG